LILPSAGAPGETKAEGAACCGSPSLGPSAALQGLRSGCRRSGQGGMAVWGGRPFCWGDRIYPSALYRWPGDE